MNIFIRNLLFNFIVIIIIFQFFYVNVSAKSISGKFENINKIEYRFYDSAVPPAYHRSYTITLTSSALHFVVDSYGEIIKDVTVPVSSSKWENAKASFNEAHIKNVLLTKEDKTCTGGTAISIKLFENDLMLFDGHSYECNNQFYGNLEGDLKGFLDTLKKGIPKDIFFYK